jgi:hypothetical protein
MILGSGEKLAGLMTVSLNIISWGLGENEVRHFSVEARRNKP